MRIPCAGFALAVGLLACPMAVAQQSEGTAATLEQSQTVDAAHKFIPQALTRAEASLSGYYDGSQWHDPPKNKGLALLSNYVGRECQSTFIFGQTSIEVNWAEVTNISFKSDRNTMYFSGKLNGSSKIVGYSIRIDSDQLAQRILSAALTLQMACDPLRSSGF